MGLNRARGTCLLSRIDSAMDLAANVVPNGISVGRVMSSGAIRAIIEGLSTAVSMQLRRPLHNESTYRPVTTSIPLYQLFI